MKRVLPSSMFLLSVFGLMAICVATISLAAPTYAQSQELTTELQADPIQDTGAMQTVHQAESRVDDNMVTMTGLVEAMSNNLGQLHFLRTLCFGDDDQKWRTVASGMMRIEAPQNTSYRSQLIRAFNAGYYAQKGRYHDCSSAVALDVAALSENGRQLATMLGDPYRER